VGGGEKLGWGVPFRWPSFAPNGVKPLGAGEENEDYRSFICALETKMLSVRFCSFFLFVPSAVEWLGGMKSASQANAAKWLGERVLGECEELNHCAFGKSLGKVDQVTVGNREFEASWRSVKRRPSFCFRLFWS
jgi:hypothetical protein